MFTIDIKKLVTGPRGVVLTLALVLIGTVWPSYTWAQEWTQEISHTDMGAPEVRAEDFDAVIINPHGHYRGYYLVKILHSKSYIEKRRFKARVLAQSNSGNVSYYDLESARWHNSHENWESTLFLEEISILRHNNPGDEAIFQGLTLIILDTQENNVIHVPVRTNVHNLANASAHDDTSTPATALNRQELINKLNTHLFANNAKVSLEY